MEPTTSGRYRAFERPRDPAELVLVARDAASDRDDAGPDRTDGDADDPAAYEPTYVRTDGYDGALAEAVEAVEPGNVVDATLAWEGGDARFRELSVVRRTRVRFYDGVTDLFEAARETWRNARVESAAINGRVTRDTDGDPNGALYVFAKQSGVRDLFAEFRDGRTPLEPLFDRLDTDGDPGPREAFVMRPADEPFLVVYIAFERDGLLARTVRETYGEASLDRSG